MFDGVACIQEGLRTGLSQEATKILGEPIQTSEVGQLDHDTLGSVSLAVLPIVSRFMKGIF